MKNFLGVLVHENVHGWVSAGGGFSRRMCPDEIYTESG